MRAAGAEVTFVTFMADDRPYLNGFEPERIGVPLVILGTDDAVDALAARPRSPQVSIERVAPGCDLRSPEQRLRLLATRAARARSERAAWCWLDTTFVMDHVSLELLYAGFIAGAVRTDLGTGPVAAWHEGYDDPVLLAVTAGQVRTAGGFAGLKPLLAGATALAGRLQVRHRSFVNPSASHQLAATLDVPTIRVLGDSHTLYGFTPARRLGRRTDILVATHEVSQIPVPYAHQFTHHHGPLTMHRLGRSNDLAPEMLTARGIHDGDPLTFVAGEIDVRCHIVRQQCERGRLLDEVVETLSARYISRLATVARAFPKSPVCVFGVTPPFDALRYGDEQMPIYGTLAERVAASRRLNAALARRALLAGLHYFDAYDELADADGTLPLERSDYFCHIGHGWKHVVTDRFYRLVNALAPSFPGPSAAGNDGTADGHARGR